MKNNWLLPVASALLIAPMLISCSSTERLKGAASDLGKVQASVELPSLPDDCRKQEPHAAIREGDELRSVLVMERGALNRSNARVARCAAFYDDVKKNFADPAASK